ncbi:GntR family transcriptional regulator [Streptomyces nigrescens]|uniref:GntR family transcriptional regulator n=1 Tax=Streptomyces nigrescens TaxID=1920 RepID=A0ABN6QRM0_STRNI|nr:GntR family transcriptional regulator [Streptomyces nigrescens]BDM67316.1 GntR family transcriptional regulator [Streptomyces nigrescens]
MAEIQRPGALYQQVAAAIREAILSGEFEPGAPLPSEAQLIERYKVSRPTVRNAIAALRAEGLIEVKHGKGSFVRSSGLPVLTVERRVSLSGADQFTTADGETWKIVDGPSVYRTQTTAATGSLLQLGEREEVFGCDRTLLHQATGARALHRTLIPFATADQVPGLADSPDAEPEAIYGMLANAGHELWWHETVRARMPLPDERSALHLPDATPVLHTTRTTHRLDRQALILEELCLGADRAQLGYRITADEDGNARTATA